MLCSPVVGDMIQFDVRIFFRWVAATDYESTQTPAKMKKEMKDWSFDSVDV